MTREDTVHKDILLTFTHVNPLTLTTVILCLKYIQVYLKKDYIVRHTVFLYRQLSFHLLNLRNPVSSYVMTGIRGSVD